LLRIIEQYLSDEGFLATKLVLHDEAHLKAKERDERAAEGRKLRRAILGAYPHHLRGLALIQTCG
jgi:COMPASS component SWD3